MYLNDDEEHPNDLYVGRQSFEGQMIHRAHRNPSDAVCIDMSGIDIEQERDSQEKQKKSDYCRAFMTLFRIWKKTLIIAFSIIIMLCVYLVYYSYGINQRTVLAQPQSCVSEIGFKNKQWYFPHQHCIEEDGQFYYRKDEMRTYKWSLLDRTLYHLFRYSIIWREGHWYSKEAPPFYCTVDNQIYFVSQLKKDELANRVANPADVRLVIKVLKVEQSQMEQYAKQNELPKENSHKTYVLKVYQMAATKKREREPWFEQEDDISWQLRHMEGTVDVIARERAPKSREYYVKTSMILKYYSAGHALAYAEGYAKEGTAKPELLVSFRNDIFATMLEIKQEGYIVNDMKIENIVYDDSKWKLIDLSPYFNPKKINGDPDPQKVRDIPQKVRGIAYYGNMRSMIDRAVLQEGLNLDSASKEYWEEHSDLPSASKKYLKNYPVTIMLHDAVVAYLELFCLLTDIKTLEQSTCYLCEDKRTRHRNYWLARSFYHNIFDFNLHSALSSCAIDSVKFKSGDLGPIKSFEDWWNQVEETDDMKLRYLLTILNDVNRIDDVKLVFPEFFP